MSISTFSVLILILIELKSSSTGARNQNLNIEIYQPPSITFQWWLPDGEENTNKWSLIGDLPEAAKNEIVVDEGNHTFTFGDSAWGLAINCSASYPVEWVPQLNKVRNLS